MTKKLKKAIQKQKRKTKQEVPQIYGLLGLRVSGRTVEVPNRNSYVYVRLRNNESEVIQAFNNKVAPAYNLPVIVERHKNRYTVVSVDTERYENNWSSFSPFLPRHGNTHSFNLEAGGGGDAVWVYPQQFTPALIFPSGSVGAGNLIMHPYTIKNSDGTWKYVGNTGTPNISQHKPTMPTGAVMVLVYLDSISGNPQILVGSGSYFSAAITGASAITPYVPALTDPNYIPLAAIRLVTGTSAISWNNIYDVRQWLHTTPTGTGGGLSSVTVQDEGVSQGTATTFNFVGGNVSATVSGDTARIFITGSAGGTGTNDATYLRLDTSNNPLTGQLQIIPPAPNVGGLYAQTLGNAYTADIEQYATGTVDVESPTMFLYRSPVGDSAPTFHLPMIYAVQTKESSTMIGGFVVFDSDAVNRVIINPNVLPTGTMTMFDSDASVAAGGHLLLLKNAGSPRLRVGGDGALEFGLNVFKEANAGKIGYQLFDSYFDIVGAGTGSSGRTVQLYDILRVGTNIISPNFTSSTLPNVLLGTDSNGTFVSKDAPLTTGTYGRQLGAWAEVAPLNGWIQKTETWTRVTNEQFTVSGDVTATYRKGTKVRYEILGGYGYSVIASSSHGGGTTTVNLIPTADFGMPSSPTGRWLCYTENPEGFPTSFAASFAVTGITATSGTLVQRWTAEPGKFKFFYHLTFGASSAITGDPTITLPITMPAYGGVVPPVGLSEYVDGGSVVYAGVTVVVSTTAVKAIAYNVAGTYASIVNVSSTVPFTWTTTDTLQIEGEVIW
jgi:hypothetical protein